MLEILNIPSPTVHKYLKKNRNSIETGNMNAILNQVVWTA